MGMKPGNTFAQQNRNTPYDMGSDFSRPSFSHNGNAIILNQNSPNPFSDKTIITYYIPKDVQNAVINVYDNQGNPVKNYRIDVRGDGEVILYAWNMRHGMYNYNLVVDGRLVESKGMIH